ncbi:nickel/cobalt transporter [Musicola keenii]|uniref:nickel/cobalt transporter n=1 Tax=Musicola keenii TaxID=2884250 RepID=UPI00177B5A12|nr:nickel/cobalt transporter [Musicola keenii]
MPVNLPEARIRLTRGTLALLALAALLLAGGVWMLVLWWPSILMLSVMGQKVLHQQMADLMAMVQTQPQKAGVTLMGFSLAYGVLHAVGPGHGKVVITAYLATHPSRLKGSLQMTFAAALLQGMMAIGVTTLVLMVFQLSSRTLHLSSFWMEKGSFVLVVGLGGWLCFRALGRLWRLLHSADMRKPRLRIQHLHPLADTPTSGRQSVLMMTDTAGYDAVCGCGHQHVPDAMSLNRAEGWRTRLMIVLAMGLRPCSGAIMVLLFAKVLGVFIWGVMSALAMAMGTAMTVSLLGALVFFCRRQMERIVVHRSSSWQIVVWPLLSLAGGLVLVCSGMALYLSSEAGILGGSPLFG